MTDKVGPITLQVFLSRPLLSKCVLSTRSQMNVGSKLDLGNAEAGVFMFTFNRSPPSNAQYTRKAA